MSNDRRFTVAAGEGGRADRILARRFPELGSRRLARYFDDGHVRVNGKAVKKGAHVAPGTTIELTAPPPTAENLRVQPVEDPSLEVIAANDCFIAINKQAGKPSHPLRVSETNTAANAIVARYPECADIGDDPREAGLVHRLDAGTTGVLVAARTEESWRELRGQFGSGTITKEYLALVHGRATAGASTAPLKQAGGRSHASASAEGAMTAETRWRVEASYRNLTLLRCRARTGRMHQVRAHLAGAGHPIYGDQTYGAPAEDALPGGGFFLHAAAVEFRDPGDGSPVRLHAELPPARLAFLEQLDRGD